MTKEQEIQIYAAIADAVNAAYLQFGIEGIKSLSMFPSAWKTQQDNGAEFKQAA